MQSAGLNQMAPGYNPAGAATRPAVPTPPTTNQNIAPANNPAALNPAPLAVHNVSGQPPLAPPGSIAAALNQRNTNPIRSDLPALTKSIRPFLDAKPSLDGRRIWKEIPALVRLLTRSFTDQWQQYFK
jgi:hypothetical protein